MGKYDEQISWLKEAIASTEEMLESIETGTTITKDDVDVSGEWAEQLKLKVASFKNLLEAWKGKNA